MTEKTGYILGIARGHNGGVCLIKDGEIVFAIEEERLSRLKYDGGPFAAMNLATQYTDKIDYLVVSHTQSLRDTAGKVDFSADDVYTGYARKMGLIANTLENPHPQVIDVSNQHHKIHAACAFYRSGFDSAVAVVCDGAGSAMLAMYNDNSSFIWETESIIDCDYPSNFKTLYKHYGTRDTIPFLMQTVPSDQLGEPGEHTHVVSNTAGITKVYEAVSVYCGFQEIEAGKTMGLSPYGKPNKDIPKLFSKEGKITLSNANLIVPRYPNGAIVNHNNYESLAESVTGDDNDHSKLQNRRDMAYACQKETQEQVLDLILTAAKLTGKKKVVLSGGYGLNCVANYFYLDRLNEEGIELYVEPISNDGGTSIGAALYWHMLTTQDEKRYSKSNDVYLGPEYDVSEEMINSLVEKYKAESFNKSPQEVIELMREKNIIAVWQGRSENGPRALGNRTLMFDPTYEDGKDYVNQIKKREYFRPFAGSILVEDVHEWFDLKGMEDSPTMMYAVNCLEGVEKKIPSIIHVDGTCRIQTVSREQNPLYYELIEEFKKQTGVPIVFNTSFNLGGEPLVETLEDALRTLKESDIQYLYLPEYGKLITVGNFDIV